MIINEIGDIFINDLQQVESYRSYCPVTRV